MEWKDGLVVIHEVFVQRYQCSSCGHTHALLSSALVPYSSYFLCFILVVLRDYFLGRTCVQKLCSNAGIAVSTLYRWKALFLAHKALWLGVLEDLRTSAKTFLKNMDGVFRQGFFRKFLVSFLQRLRGTSLYPPFRPPGQIIGFLDDYTGDTVCSKQLYREVLHHEYDEPKRWQIHSINEIMNTAVIGWKPFGFWKEPRSREWKCRPYRDSVEKFKRTLKKLTNRSQSMTFEARIQKLNWVISGWINYFALGSKQ